MPEPAMRSQGPFEKPPAADGVPKASGAVPKKIPEVTPFSWTKGGLNEKKLKQIENAPNGAWFYLVPDKRSAANIEGYKMGFEMSDGKPILKLDHNFTSDGVSAIRELAKEGKRTFEDELKARMKGYNAPRHEKSEGLILYFRPAEVDLTQIKSGRVTRGREPGN